MVFIKSLFFTAVLAVALPASASSVHGIFKVVKGQVEVISKEGQKKKARIGLKVFPEDTVKTGKDSRAKIVMVDKNEINVSPESEFSLSKYEYNPDENKKDVMINVIYGKIRAKVSQKYDGDNKFRVKTPTAVAGVRGTDFITAFTPATQESRVITFEGRVEFGVPGVGDGISKAVMVVAGQSSILNGSQPSAPMQLPVAELGDLNQESDASLAAEPAVPRPESTRQPAKSPEDSKEEPSTAPQPRRLPNSTGTFIQPQDVASGDVVYTPPPEFVPVLPPPLPQLLPYDPTCGDACRTIIESGTRSLIINVENQ